MNKIIRRHWVSLIIRFVLFVFYLLSTVLNVGVFKSFSSLCNVVIWLFFMVSMLHRLLLSDSESMGNQKVYSENYKATNNKIEKKSNKSIILIGSLWLLGNLIFGILHIIGVLNNELMLLLCLFYSVCDIICILWYCPFQRWFMKNKCCNTCRIYNWDYPMMFTPLLFVPNLYNYSLVGISLIILFVWEYSFYKHPERFYEESNENLACKNCKEFMCKNKWRKIENSKNGVNKSV